MAATKTTKKKAKAPSKPKTVGTVALVVRVPLAAMDYIDKNKGDRPRTAFLRSRSMRCRRAMSITHVTSFARRGS